MQIVKNIVSKPLAALVISVGSSGVIHANQVVNIPPLILQKDEATRIVLKAPQTQNHNSGKYIFAMNGTVVAHGTITISPVLTEIIAGGQVVS